MAKELDRVSTPKGLGLVVGIPLPGRVEVRLLDSMELFIFEDADVVMSPGEVYFIKKLPPEVVAEGVEPVKEVVGSSASVYDLADDTDRAMLEVIQAAEQRARQLHEAEQRQYERITGGSTS